MKSFRPQFSVSLVMVMVMFMANLVHATTERTLYSFGTYANKDGMELLCKPAVDAKGNVFGTTLIGGTYNAGMIFELSPTPNNQWAETILYEFTGGSDGGIRRQA